MSTASRLLDLVDEMAGDGQFERVLASTFTFEPRFFVHTGVLPALAGVLDRSVDADGFRRQVAAAVVRDALGNPFVGVVQGCPSQGHTPYWIDRVLWPTGRLGVQHAKCLVARGRTRTWALVTSANLTEGSWCGNLEVAAAWSAPVQPATAADRAAAEAIANVVFGLARLAEEAGAAVMAGHATELGQSLRHGARPDPAVVWSGKLFAERPLDRLESGDELVVTSPFWPRGDAGAALVAGSLARLAPTVSLAGRAVPGGSTLEMPTPMADRARASRFLLRVALPPAEEETSGVRLLHAKQISLRAGASWRSYLGSANATVQGLGLQGLANIELGVIVDAAPLFESVATPKTQPPPTVVDPDDPDSWLTPGTSPAVLAGRYANARLDATRRLHLIFEPAPGAGAMLEVPAGAAPHALSRSRTQHLDLDVSTVEAVMRRPEVVLVTADATRLHVPVLVDEELQQGAGAAACGGKTDLDVLLDQLRRDPARHPPDDQGDDGDTTEPLPGETGRDGAVRRYVPRKPVHRAREAVEVITAAQAPLEAFLKGTSPPLRRLVELRLGGPGSIVDLARMLAATAGTDQGMSQAAAAFAVVEIQLLLGRLVGSAPDPGGLAGLREEVARLVSSLLAQVADRDKTAATRLRTLQQQP